MIKLEKYTGEKTYMFPTGALATPEVVYNNYPAAKVFTFVVGTDKNSQVMQSMDNLSVLRDVYDIAPELSEDEAIAEIETIMNTPQEPIAQEPTAEERIAAALEYQVMSSLPDETTESEAV